MQNPNMAFSSVNELIKYLDKSQYTHVNSLEPCGNIITKYDLQKIIIDPTVPVSTTSGSTGIPVTVPRTPESAMWYTATNIRELQWRKWDLKKKCVAILARIKEDKICDNIYYKKLDSMINLQKYLEIVQPNYLYTYPTIVNALDLTKLVELIDVKTVGEIGGTNYSCEEAGTIALQCPEYNTYHIMENMIVQVDDEHGVLITELTNPLITRYALGDIVELGTEPCKCGRTLPTITKICGRLRNMMLLPDGSKIWPTIGEPLFNTITKKIIRHQTIQKTLYHLELNLQVNEILNNDEECNLKNLVLKTLNYGHIICDIKYVDGFKSGKFEIFKCEV